MHSSTRRALGIAIVAVSMCQAHTSFVFTRVYPTTAAYLALRYSCFFVSHMSTTTPSSSSQALASLLRQSPRILCLVGAGLSAPSGLPTWRGANRLWEGIDIKCLASPKTFAEDPVTVWKFYAERLRDALAAQPNAAHYALAALAQWHDGWLTVNQNVDGEWVKIPLLPGADVFRPVTTNESPSLEVAHYPW
jgi:hypothetical protein